MGDKAQLDISVVIAAFNAQTTLSEQLQALAAQEGVRSWEVVVADNGSTDGTRALVESLAETFPVDLRVIDASERRGVAHARNRGVAESRGRSIAFCDADDRVGDGWLAAVCSALESYDAVGGELREYRLPFDPNAPSVGYEAYRPGGVLGGNMAIRRDVFLRVGGLSEELPRYGGEDSELSLRLRQAGARIGPAPGMVLYFRPTTSLRATLRKVYLGSKAEVIIWHLHPSQFPVQQSRTILLREALGLPVAVAEVWRRGGKRPAARLLVRFVAHLSMLPRWRGQPQKLRRQEGAASAEQAGKWNA